jgi:hypothetical protein
MKDFFFLHVFGPKCSKSGQKIIEKKWGERKFCWLRMWLSGSDCNIRSKRFEHQPIKFGLGRKTQDYWVLTQTHQPRVWTPNLSVLSQGRMQDPKDLSLRPCHSQATWVRLSFLDPSFLSLEEHVKSKLIIIIIIDFILQIKSMFLFDSNKIYFKFNNINEFNNIIKFVWPNFL